MIEKRVKFGDYLGKRMDVSFYQDRFNFSSKAYPSYSLSELLFVNPTIKYENLSENDTISFVPMEVVDEKNGKIAEQRETSISKTKGFTRFKENDLIWAKITPCMQNGKSAIARDLMNGYGCGSTEFYVLRPKKDNVLIEYIHFILRDKRVLESAKTSFGGSAGQQRVTSGYVKSIELPLPPRDIQQKIVDLYNDAVNEKQAKEQAAKILLESIDVYLLKELGIELPENTANERYFGVNISELTGGQLDVKSTRFKTYKRKSIKYDEIFLSKIASITKGKSITKEKIIKGDYPVIAGGQTSPYSHSEYNEIENAITISASGSAGYVWFHDYKIFASDCSIVRSKNEAKYLQLYIYSILKLKQDEIYRLQKGAIQPHVYPNDIAAITIPIIDIQKQQEIVKDIQVIQTKATLLQNEAGDVLEKAKKEVERIIKG
jgi:type I restriction enzyme S subunit